GVVGGGDSTLGGVSLRLVLALPIFELGPRASEDDPLAGDAPRADLAGVEVLDDVRRDQRGEHEDADGRVRVVADLVRALPAARERDDVAVAQLLLALVRAQRRLAAEDDRPFLVRVVGVKWPLLVTRLDLVHARADQLGVGVRADPGVLEAPALALFRAIPLVCVEIEDLHAASLVGRCWRRKRRSFGQSSSTCATARQISSLSEIRTGLPKRRRLPGRRSSTSTYRLISRASRSADTNRPPWS